MHWMKEIMTTGIVSSTKHFSKSARIKGERYKPIRVGIDSKENIDICLNCTNETCSGNCDKFNNFRRIK